MDSPTPTDALPEIDWGAEGIESELGWALPLALQGFTRLGGEAVADVPGGPRGYQVLVATTTEEPCVRNSDSRSASVRCPCPT